VARKDRADLALDGGHLGGLLEGRGGEIPPPGMKAGGRKVWGLGETLPEGYAMTVASGGRGTIKGSWVARERFKVHQEVLRGPFTNQGSDDEERGFRTAGGSSGTRNSEQQSGGRIRWDAGEHGVGKAGWWKPGTGNDARGVREAPCRMRGSTSAGLTDRAM